MRYADGGGLTARERARREALRRDAAAMFASGIRPAEVAARLRVTPRSVYRWKRKWAAGGAAALASEGPGGQRCKLGPHLLARLAAMLDAGPAAYGWDEDQVWTGARVAALIRRKFRVSYSASGATRLMRRLGFTPQMPGRRAAERDEQAVAAWKEVTWPEVKERRRPAAAGSVSRTRRASTSGRPGGAPGDGAGTPRS